MAKYGITLNKTSQARRKSWWILLPQVLSIGGIAFSVMLVAWNFSFEFSETFPFTIHLAYCLGFFLLNYCIFTRHLSESPKWLKNIPDPTGKRDTRSLVRWALYFQQPRLGNKPPAPFLYPGLLSLAFPAQHLELCENTHVSVRETWR